MVRILTCHHFGGQKIGRCEEALQLAVADDLIIVALEHQVAVYSSELSSSSDGHSEHSKLTQGATRDGGDIGSSPIFFMKKPGGAGKPKATAGSKGGSELVLSHSFPTVDLIDSISYNGRGNYLLCLEKRESSDGKKLSRSVRVYFNWDTSKEGKPMRARIAGLVSPTGADPDDDTLVMVEIPTTSPTGSSPPPNIVGAASCNILGHLATLADTNVVNIYAYKLKEVKGRASKSQYSDFDLSYAVEVSNFSPDSARIEFLADIIAVSNETTVHVFRLTKQSRTRSRTASNDSGGSFTSSGRRSVLSGASSIAGNTLSGPASLPNPTSNNKSDQVFDKVVFDPKNESVKVHMNLITRVNQKSRFPDAGTGIHEVYQEMIGSKTKLIFSANAPALSIEDLVRIGIGHDSSPSIVQVGLYPVKIKDDLGGISCIVGMSSQALVYHVPAKLDCNVVRVVTYPLTAPLVSFAFDSMFFHALTETGLETYTSRSLYYPLKEFEGFQRHHNDCPFIDETPSLVGIRPFMGVRYMAANEFLLCLLASPSITHSTSASPSFVEDSLWTIYALQLPSIQLLSEDLSKASQAAKAGNLDTFVTLATELHLVLRTHVNMYPESEPHFRKPYQKTCKTIGMEYWKKATIRYDEAIQLSEGTDKYRLENQAEEALDKGVTFLTMAGVDLKHIFEEEPNLYLKDRSIVRGVTRFASVALRNEGQPVSPKLTATVTDFLVSQSPETLVDLVTEVPLLRETNSAKLIQIIRKLAESSGYKRAECVALLLTIVTAGGCDSGTRSSVKEVLQKCKTKDSLDSSFKLEWLMDFKVVTTKPKLTDLAICLSTARPSIPANVISHNLEKSKVNIGQVLMAFSQGINLSSDVDVQNSLTQTMTTILEKYFTEKLKAASNRQAIYNNLANQVNYENGLVSSKAALKPLEIATVDLTDDETHAVNTLARSYVSRIALKPATQHQRHNSGETNAHASISPAHTSKEPSEDAKKAAEAPKSTLTEAKVTPFGKLPNFIVHIIKETHTFVNSNVSSFQVTALLPGVTEETKEFFMKLGSLLTSPLGNAAGVKDVVLNFLETKGQPGAPLHVCLEILAASYDKAVQALIAKFPFALMYYAKDTFGRSTAKWKFLVTKLKEKIYDNKEDVDIFATIIEGVYLHVANTLSPSELEEVLDKGEENSRFFTACRRTELANSYNQMIVQMSNEYL